MEASKKAKYLDYEGLGHFYSRIKKEQVQYSSGVPFGIIAMWAGSKIPTGWALCDGTNGTPDLSSKFIIGAESVEDIGHTGGSEVSIPEIGVIDDTEIDSLLNDSGISELAANEPIASVTPLSEDDSIDIMPPYYTLAYIMRLSSIDEDSGIIFRFKGSVQNLEALKSEHSTDNKIGDVYNTLDTGRSYAWNGEEWAPLGSSFYLDPISNSDILTLFK